jgi:hypothetical protein
MKTTPPTALQETAGLFWLITLMTVSAAPPMADDFESGLATWQTTGTWALTTSHTVSPTHSATDTPGAYYTNNSDSALTLASSITLASTRPALAFHHAHMLENQYDFARVEISTNGGASWSSTPLASYTGNRAVMAREQIDLPSFAGEANAKIRFRMTTDASIVMDGWYVDDVIIGSAPKAVVLNTPSGSELGQTHVTLRWGASTDPDFSSYIILRGTQTGFDWRTAKTVATLTNPATLEFTDIAVAPKSTYHYRIMTLTGSGLHSLSNEESAITPAGMDYPFLDDGEAGPNLWVATAQWSLSNEDYQSPSHAWSDSPGGNYADGIASQPLTLAAPLDLTSAAKPVLTFHHCYSLASGDTANVEISSNQGSSWNSVGTYTTGTLPWNQARIPLTSYAGQPSVLVRFRLTTNASENADGWHVDDISVAEAPATVASPAVDQITSHTLRLTWNASSSLPFSHYAIHRSTSPGVGINSPRVAVISNQSQTQFSDSGLALDTLYYYRVYAVSPYGTYSADSASEAAVRTLNNPLPFAENFDENLLSWNTGAIAGSSAWSLSTEVKRTGVAALGSSPGSSYAPNSDTYIETAVDLRGTDWPVLSFWDRFGLNSGDWFRLEISATGGPTYYCYGAMESSRGAWQRQRIDLSPWKGLGNVKLRFRLVSDNAPTPGEGWFIDDLTVAENPNRNTPLALPFTDDFESGATGWLLSGWNAIADADPVNNACVLRCGAAERRMSPETQQWAVLDRPVILPAASKVQATFWLRGRLEGYSGFRLHYSANGGVHWSEFAEVNRDTGYNSNGEWNRGQATLYPLSAGAPQTARLRFSAYCNPYAPIVDLSIDKVTVTEMPAAVAMRPIDEVGVTSLRLNWTPSALPEFSAYALYRSTASNVSDQSTLVATLSNPETASFTDTDLESRVQYYYRIYIIDQRDTYSPSEAVSATTLGIPLPLADDFESAQPGWTFTGQWRVQNGVGRDGGAALVDSPGDYLAGTDTHARFAVNLNGSQWPVLRYWDRHNFSGTCWGRVEISTNNSSWTIVGGVSETRDTWKMQEIDLSPWKNQTRVFIRFRCGTDGNLSDGWTIDDLGVSDRAVGSVYPFFDGFESGIGNWMACAWTGVTESSHAGSSCAQDTVNRRNPPDTPNQLTLARELDLTTASAPQLTFFIRGTLEAYSSFRVQVSTDGGLTWPEISLLNLDTGFNSAVWLRQQVSLATWNGQRIRLRFVSSGNSYLPASDIFLDNIGIGEAAPGAPTPVTPLDNQTVEIVRPTLTVNNAIDYQSDALTHQFEVYADAALTQPVAQIPAVASGVSTTSWQVDVDLPDHAPYWWRARASDGTNTGPWSDTVVFNINEFNNPPLTVLIAGPANDSLLIDGNGLLAWFQTIDPDLGDQIRDYQIQIDNDYLFGSPEVNASGITVDSATYGPGFLASISLGDLPGTGTLPSGRWFWRIRARDTRFSSGAWSGGYAYFRLPTFYQRYLRSIYGDPDWFLYDVSNPGADPDGNGVGVLMEFACAIAPGANPGNRLPRAIELPIEGATHQGFEWTRRKDSELDFLLEVSSDLSRWQTDIRGSVEILHALDGISERVRIVDPDPVGSHYKRFIRMRVRN